MILSEKIKSKISQSIYEGTFRPGDRLPSLRRLSRSMNVSVTTVKEAYARLEDVGLISSRERSGYFVLPQTAWPVSRQVSSGVEKPVRVPFAGLMVDLLSEDGTNEMVRLGIAQPEPDILPLAQLNRVRRRIIRSPGLKTSNYCDPGGLPTLRRAIASRLLDRGISCPESEIVITNGCQQALKIALETTMKEGDIVAIESPCYPGLLHILSHLKLQALEIPCRPGTGIDLMLLTEALNRFRIAALVLTPTCANPNGSIIPTDARQEILALCEHHGFLIIEDDTNCELAFTHDPPPAIRSYDTGKHVLYCGSFSKVYGPGMRVGWLVAGDRRPAAVAMKYVEDLGGAPLEQHVLAQYLVTKEAGRAIQGARRAHHRTVTEMVRCIRASFPEGTHVDFPEGGFLIWVELPAGIDSEVLRTRALASNISIATGPIFSPTGTYRNYIRIGWGGLWTDKIRNSVEILGSLAKSLLKPPARPSA